MGLVAALASAPTASAQGAHKQTIAVLPFEIEDTSGEVGQSARHDAMLKTITGMVAEDIADKRIYRVVPEADVAAAVIKANSGTYLRSCNGCELDIAKSVGADTVMIGWFYKVSTLIGTLHIVVKDVDTGKTVYAHVFDFRGDNEKAWRRAADYMIGSLAKRTRQEVNTN